MPKQLEFLLAIDNTRFNRALDASQAKVMAVGRRMASGFDPLMDKLKAVRSSAANMVAVGAAVGGAAALGGLYGFVQAVGAAAAESAALDTAAFNMQSSLEAANRQFELGSAAKWEEGIKSLQATLRVYSETELRNATAKTIDMTKRLGLSADQMKKVIEVSGELGAGKFGLAESVERTTAALRGEAEASEALGLTLNENYVKSWHEANNATGKAWKDLTDLEKAQIRYNVLLEQAGPTLGKAAASVNTYQGALTLATNSVDGMKVAVGEAITKNQFFVEGMKIVSQEIDAWTGKIKANGPEVREYAKATALALLQMGEAGLTSLDYIYRGSQGIAGVFQKTAAFALDVSGGIFKIVEAGATLTDFLGITTGATEEWATAAEAAFGAADELGAKADANFQEMQDGAPKIQQARDALKHFREELEKVPANAVGDISKEADGAADKTDKLTNQTKQYERQMVEVNGVWKEQLVAVEKVTDEVDKIDRKLDALDGRTINVTVREKIAEAHQVGGMIGALAMNTGGAVAMRNMLSGGHFPGFGGGDRRHVIAEDGEYMLDKYRVRDAGLQTVRDFHYGRYGAVVEALMEKMQGVRRQYGGLIDNVVAPVRQYMPQPQAMTDGGSVVGGSSMLKHEHTLKSADGMRATVYTDDLNADRLFSMLQRAFVMSS
ncbi:hypothetical protein [Desulfopila aestuarii]|uniref:Uncharacterized protein n=1 Tax=Desulfopila aestuarii DSM 18488 TaxID=1121416 RepID=A0A1M7YJQ0_9BACT|nr:hypothetical protein [Desulfopila aestuarii]SHO52840.1 hypothetical protein SAMN02745220_04796 [Desulfopila aestuarii DSM 18488]